MRYVLLDRIIDIDPGRSLRAVKHVRASDELVTRYAPGVSALPASMLFEAMAQAAGLLVIATLGCERQPVLAKLQPGQTMGLAQPGDRIDVTANIIGLRDMGAVAFAAASIDEHPLASAQIYLALVPHTGDDRHRRAESLRAHLDATFPGWFAAATRVEARP